MWKKGKLSLILLLMLWWLGMLQAEAAYEGIPNISMSADGSAFTSHAGDKNAVWYEKGTEAYTGVAGTIGEPREGEHLYKKVCSDIVPVEKWVVSWKEAKCIHKIYPAGNMIYGESFNRQNCMEKYYSGWLAYCADCKEPVISNYVYMSKDTARGLPYMDLSKAYFFKCPHCNNLEQALLYEKHVCRDISPNRYYVRYHANLGSGYMEKSVHMVNDAAIYEGQEVTPQTTLNLNTYTRKGYEFAGWNTRQDGSGEKFADGAKIRNLSLEQNADVVLYAQWRKSKSVLELDPAGGSYAGEKGIIRIEGEYASHYQPDLNELTAPMGYTVHFDTQGGEAVSDLVGNRVFAEWSCAQPFGGVFIDNCYSFLGADGNIDRMTAVYTDVPVSLPAAQREGYSFGGWYADRDCTIPIGGVGDKFTPREEITLYAGWAELLLTAEENDTANQGKGAVNLSWDQKDGLEKVYQVYQRTDNTDWIQIGQTQESQQGFQVTKTISFSGEEGSYTVPYSGLYTLTLTGAQGGNYGNYQGGKGGLVQAAVYLEKGEKLSYIIGGQSGFCGGGQGKTYGNGGGYSRVSSERLGVLLIAGGGGGASNSGDGGAGGSAAHVVTSETGQDGEAGGGGGSQGGSGGRVERHEHTGSCRHIHVGAATGYGGCYTKPAECGSKQISKKEDRRVFYYGNIANDGSHKFCERCGSDVCPGHLDIYYKFVCDVCGASSPVQVAKCSAITAYEPDCGLSDAYICGMEEGQILWAEPAYGGSSYVNTSDCLDYMQETGAQTGDGKLIIVSRQLGLLEDNLLSGVAATDMAPPDMIAQESILKTAIGEDKIRVSFAPPEDNGTAYYHMAESYNKATNEQLCTSNQTKNTLISGVAGYGYVVNEDSDTIVEQGHAYYEEQGEAPFLAVEVGEDAKYLHVAAVDKAGNIGPTTHIVISPQDVIYWPLLTEKLEIEEEDRIYPAAAADTYYVRADNSTPFTLTLEGLLCGTAREKYQINLAGFQVQNLSDSSRAGQFSVMIPNREAVMTGIYTYPMSQLQKKQEGILGLQDAAYTMAKRYNMCKSLTTVQKFILSRTYDGQQLQVTPRVAAVGEQETIWSQEENDLQHSIYLIADGKGPDITGTERLADLELLDLAKEEGLAIEFQAADTGSGLARFYVEVRNLENGIIMRYTDDALTGRISIEISEAEEVFHGEFTIGVYAQDHVGNETSVQDKLLSVGLLAYVERILEPHTPVFKKGESGILHMEALGYVERVEVSFPAAFINQDASLSRIFVYERPEYLQTEGIPFIVPFTVPEGEMTICVKAYKAGAELEAEPELITITVKGSILDELRTRLR